MPDPKEAWAFLESSDPISSAEEVQAAIARIASEIEARLAKTYPLVLVVMGGAVVFAGQLLPRLRFPLDLDYVGLRISDRFVFGCGMDAKGFWRNLPEIRAMRES